MIYEYFRDGRIGIVTPTLILAMAVGCAGCAAPPTGDAHPHSSAKSGSAKVDRAAILSAHNKWRAEVGVANLSYSPELEASARAWAEHLQTTNHCQMQHSQGEYGENLYWASAIKWSDGRRELQTVAPALPVESWTSEKSNYDYATNECSPGKVCGHYTQVVWRGTQKVGCAFAVCPDTLDQIWVCQYQPAGNWVGEKPY